jgi:hypothetical protein
MAAHIGAATGGGLALAALIGAGDHGAADAWQAIEITAAVVIVLVVMGLLAALIIRARGGCRRYRPDPAIRPLRVRAVVTGRNPPFPPPVPPRGPERPGAAGSGDVPPCGRTALARPLAIGPGGARGEGVPAGRSGGVESDIRKLPGE